MDPKALKVLAVHGIGDYTSNQIWEDDWNQAVLVGMQGTNLKLKNDTMVFVKYGNKFERYSPGLSNISSAAYVAMIGCLDEYRKKYFGSSPRSTRNARFLSYINPFGLQFDFNSVINKLNMVVNWVSSEELRVKLRKHISDYLKEHNPDIVCAHSLGALICYDLFSNYDEMQHLKEYLKDDFIFLSMGTQIGSCSVQRIYQGRITPIKYGMWFNLHNENDRVLTPPIPLADDYVNRFVPLKTTFSDGDGINHKAESYLSAPQFWRIVGGLENIPTRATTRSIPRLMMSMPEVVFTHLVVDPEEEAQIQPRRRALLVGINEYPDPSMRLEGCVNDVFTISSVLQECGFAADDIRVVFDDRATKQGLVERLHWLLDDARPGDELVFSFCGHGAQVPTYNPMGHVDHMTECLVPYDYGWSLESALSDVDLQDMYSQLPYDTRFLMLLDCCHSGGLARDGGRVIRGLNPPDDIRHRMLRWDVEKQMWVRRKFAPLHAGFEDMKDADEFVGQTGDVLRLGSAMSLRGLSNEEFDRVTKERGHHGPYMPLIIHACQEDEFAYEYQHGVISHGAFTFVLSNLLRDYNRGRGFTVSFEELVSDAAEELMDLGYDQNPDLAGPEEIRQADIPWESTLERRQQRKKRRRNKS